MVCRLPGGCDTETKFSEPRSGQELASKAPISHWCQAGSFESHRFCRCLIAILLQSFDVQIGEVRRAQCPLIASPA